MAFLDDNSLDAALDDIRTNANVLHICSAEPSTYAEATSTYTLGNKSSPTIGTAGDGDTSGRKITVSAITDGSVTGTGTASHWALVDTSNSRLKAADALASSQSVTNGNTFTLTAFDIEIPDPS